MDTSPALQPGWVDALTRARPWTPPAGRYLVVVPHPDDEAVMFGGTIAHLAARSLPLHVVAVTDGGAAYPGVAEGETLEALRRAEQAQALVALGMADAPVERLGLPDGRVAGHEAAVAEAVERLVAAHDIDVVVAPWAHDHHTDHEACGRAAQRAVERTPRPMTLVSGMFWAMLRDPATENVVLHALALNADERIRKRAAIDCHRSQVGSTVSDDPVLGQDELSITRWEHEHVIVCELEGSAS